MENFYETLLGEPENFIAETPPKQRYSLVTERHIQALWLEQKYFRALTTSQGQQIRVISPGAWNVEAGPDFRRAHLVIENQEFRGDVEIHLSDESWVHHHHHSDRRYDDVVLHLSLWRPRVEKPLKTACGREIFRTYLEDVLTIPLARLVQLIDLDLYPYKKFVGSGRCAQGVFRSLSEREAQTFFQSAAAWRLRQKGTFLAYRAKKEPLQLVAGAAMALGYKNNAEEFFELFSYLFPYRHSSEEQLLALGMGLCGFFQEEHQKKWGRSTLYSRLQERWEAVAPSRHRRFKLVLHQVRPLNHPVRRLAILAKFLADPNFITLEHLAALWEAKWHTCQNVASWKEMRDAFFEALPSYRDSYWNFHYTFESSPRSDFLSLLGEGTKREMIINVFLPLLYREVVKKQNFQETQAFHQFYETFPASKTSKSRYLRHRFFGETAKGRVLQMANVEQGAYQLHHDFCVHYEASCEGCPFVERYHALHR